MVKALVEAKYKIDVKYEVSTTYSVTIYVQY